MFSKAKVKRFNEEVGCAPPPTAYKPKDLTEKHGITLDKSDRWREDKENIPAPNAYNLFNDNASTPSRMQRPIKSFNRAMSSLSINSTSSNSSLGNARSQFLSPNVPRTIRRSNSIQSESCAERINIAKLQKEKEESRLALATLQSRLSELEEQLSQKKSVEKEVQTDLTEDHKLLREELDHLTNLRDNLEQSCTKKDFLLDQLRTQYQQMEEGNVEYFQKLNICYVELSKLKQKLAEDDGIKSLKNAITLFIDYYETLFNETSNNKLSLDLFAKASLEAELTCLQSRVDEAESNMSLLNEEKERRQEAETRLLKLDTLLKEAQVLQQFLEKELLVREQEVTVSEDKLSSLSSEYSQNKECLLRLTEVNESLKQKLESLGESVSAKEKQIEENDKHILELKQEASCQADVISRQLLSLSSLENKVSSLTAENMEVNHDNELKQRESEKKMNELLEKICCLEEERIELSTKVCSFSLSFEESSKELQDTKDTVKRLQEKLVQLTGELEACEINYKKRIECSEGELYDLATQHSNALMEHEATLSALKSTCDKLDGVQRLLDETQAVVMDLQDRLQRESSALCEKSDLCSQLEENLSDLTPKYEEALAAKSAMEGALKSGEEQLRHSEQEKAAVVAELHKLTLSANGFMTQIQQLRQDMSKKSDALEEIKECLAVTREEKRLTSIRLEEAGASLREMEEKTEADRMESETRVLSLQNEIKVMERDREELKRKTLEGLEEIKAHHQEESEAIKGQMERVEEESEAIKEQMERIKEENEAIKGQMERVKEESEAIKGQMERVKEESEAIKGQMERVKEENESFKHNEEHLKEKNQRLKEEEEERMKEEIENVKGEIERKEDSWSKEKKEMEEKMQQQEGVITCHEDAIEQLEYVRHVEYQEYEIEMECVREDLKKLQTELQESEQNNQEMSKKYSISESICKELRSKYDSYENKYKEMKTRHESTELKYKDIRTKLECVENKYDETKVKLDETVAKCKECKAKYTETEQMCKELRSKYDSSEHKCMDYKTRCDQSEARQRIMEVDMLKHKTAADKHTKALEAVEQQSKDMQRELMEMKQKLTKNSELESLFAKLKTDYESTEQQNEILRLKTEQLETLIAPFKEQLENYEKERLTLLSTESAARKQAEEMSDRYAKLIGHQNHRQKIQHVNKLKTDNFKLTEENAKLRVEVERFRKMNPPKARQNTTSRQTDKENRQSLSQTPSTKMPLGSSNRKII